MSEKNYSKCSYEAVENSNTNSGFGVRHLQIAMMFMVVAVLLIVRSSMGVAILAMTKPNLNSTANMTEDVTEDSDSETYAWNEDIRGMILSAFFWGYTINQIPGGVVAQKFGAKPLLLASLITNGIICLALPMLVKIGGWKAVFALRWLTGLTQCLFPCCHTLLGKWIPPQERTTLSTFVYAGVQVGVIISMPLCGVLARSTLGWKMIFYVMSALTFITAILWHFLSANSPSQHRLISEGELKYIDDSLLSYDVNKKPPPIPWKALLTSGPLAAILAAHIGSAYTSIFFNYIPSYINNVLDIGVRDSGILSALPYMGMWIFGIAASFLCEYISNNKILCLTASRKLFNSIGTFGPALGMVLLSYMTKEHDILAICVLSLSVSLHGATSCGYMLNPLDMSPTYAGVMLGITNSVSNFTGALGPILAGSILGADVTDPSRWRILFFISAAIVALTNIVYIAWATSERQPWDDPVYNTPAYELDTLKAAEAKEESGFVFVSKPSEGLICK